MQPPSNPRAASQPTLYFPANVKPFAQGGNRLCFVHPNDAGRCIKVLREERSPARKRQQSGWSGRLKPLRAFDDNLDEYHSFQQIGDSIGEAAFELIPRCYGFIDTNLGPGLCTELITDSDGKIARSLKQVLWQHGKTPALRAAIEHFEQRWTELAIPSRNLLLHNIVVQCDGQNIQRLVVIDGIGWSDFFPLARFIQPLARQKARRKVARLERAIEQLLHTQREGGDWGYHGWIDDSDRDVNHYLYEQK